MKKTLNKGFTLVELLAVIIVLAIVILIATREITRQMNETKGRALVTQAQALQRDFNNRCMLNGKITAAGIKAIISEDKVFKAAEVDDTKIVVEASGVKATIKIPLAGTEFSNIIAPEEPVDGIKIYANDGTTAADTTKNTQSGFVEIEVDCNEGI